MDNSNIPTNIIFMRRCSSLQYSYGLHAYGWPLNIKNTISVLRDTLVYISFYILVHIYAIYIL